MTTTPTGGTAPPTDRTNTDHHPTPADAAFVSLRGLAKSFHGQRVFEGIDLDVRAGTVTAVIGPSGGGKSTLLRCVNRLETPDAGTVTVGGVRYPADGPLDRARRTALNRTVGMVFQSFNLFPHLTAERNITLAQQRALKRPRAEAVQRSRELLDRVGLLERADAHPHTLSGGQQQRVAIARALALDPEVLLFDEPTSALDPELALDVLAVMRSLAAEGRTMIVVTHETRFAEEVSEQVVVMADGGIVEAGTPRAVLHDPAHPRARRFLASVRGR
ncbi:amino acid ABC transporter ATP-binding protein [Streptomyces paludis]|uniref:Amino acid ABC transporter ATP-binding protein n=1 Tax=Streptomyces paludis TaxID=2282738 RepID=A0A345HVZ6_9ACTN|nr:amino acid ABC transporter ATP-binding protein [Streptomyces paludis]AXG80870.1 amino acid ABC transporter ATP-binding protein [Streptomyces paludis]